MCISYLWCSQIVFISKTTTPPSDKTRTHREKVMLLLSPVSFCLCLAIADFLPSLYIFPILLFLIFGDTMKPISSMAGDDPRVLARQDYQTPFGPTLVSHTPVSQSSSLNCPGKGRRVRQGRARVRWPHSNGYPLLPLHVIFFHVLFCEYEDLCCILPSFCWRLCPFCITSVLFHFFLMRLNF